MPAQRRENIMAVVSNEEQEMQRREKFKESLNKIYDFFLGVPLLGKFLEIVTQDLVGRRKFGMLEDQVKQLERNTSDAYWLAGMNYDRIDKINERMQKLAGGLEAVAEQMDKQTVNDQQIAVLTDICASINDEIDAEKSRFRDMVRMIDESRENVETSRWASVKLNGGQEAIIDLEHAGDKTNDNGTTVLLFDREKNEFVPYDNLEELELVSKYKDLNIKDLNIEMENGEYVFSGGKIEKILPENLSLTEIVDKSIHENGINWISNMASESFRKVNELEKELDDKQGELGQLMNDQKALSAEIDKMAAEAAKKSKVSKVELKTAALINEYRKNGGFSCDAIPYPEKGKPQGILIGQKGCKHGLYVHLSKDGHMEKVSLIRNANNLRDIRGKMSLLDKANSLFDKKKTDKNLVAEERKKLEAEMKNYIFVAGDSNCCYNLSEEMKAEVEMLSRALPGHVHDMIMNKYQQNELVNSNLPKQEMNDKKRAGMETINKKIQEKMAEEASKEDGKPMNINASESYTILTNPEDEHRADIMTTDKDGGFVMANMEMSSILDGVTAEELAQFAVYANGDFVMDMNMSQEAYLEKFACSYMNDLAGFDSFIKDINGEVEKTNPKIVPFPKDRMVQEKDGPEIGEE